MLREKKTLTMCWNTLSGDYSTKRCLCRVSRAGTRITVS